MTLFRRALAAAAALLFLAQASAALAAPALWAVRDRDSTIYLFGTMHILSPDAQWRTPEYDRALAASTVVWFETDVEADADTVAPLLMKYGFDFKVPLKDKLSPKTMAAVRAAMKGFPGGAQMVEFMQPWTAATLIQMLPAMQDGMSTKDGADMTISRDLTREGQTVRYFETVEGQLRILADLPLNIQIQMLEDTLAGEDYGDQMEVGEAAWLAGEVQLYGSAMAIEMRDSRPAFYEALLRRRNQAWVNILTREMGGKGVQMVNVGALHLVGEDGLVVQLRRRGFVVERIQ